MSSYKLTYFNVRARAEPARILFALAKVPYEDVRIERSEWPAIKESFPWSQLPVLEVDGKILAQSTAIARYLGRKFGFAGTDEFQAAKCDELVDSVMDLRADWKNWFVSTDPTQKANFQTAFRTVQAPKYMSKFEKIIAANGGPFLLGKTLTWADIHVAHTLVFFQDTIDPEMLVNYPKLIEFVKEVFSVPAIKDWVERRPKTDL